MSGAEQPMIEVEARPRRARRRRSRLRAWTLRLFALLVLAGMLPLGLTWVYAVPQVRPLSTLMMKDMVTLQPHERRWTSLADLGQPIVRAVVMSEDGQFCFHQGIDMGELRSLIDDFMAGEATRGGSTVTMQTVKNLYLWHGRSYVRKAIELPLAVYFDMALSKRRIMEIYLNIAEWAPGVYGAEAAAWHHFGKPARELTARQAALLAVTLPSPATRNPARPSPGLNRLADTIERRARNADAYVRCLS